MWINRETNDAIHILLLLEGKDVQKSSTEIAAELKLSREFTLKILRRLKEAGLVTASKGFAGGYSLGRDLSAITILEVIKVTETSTDICHKLDSPAAKEAKRDVTVKPEMRKYYQYLQHIINWVCTITLQEIKDGNIDLGKTYFAPEISATGKAQVSEAAAMEMKEAAEEPDY